MDIEALATPMLKFIDIYAITGAQAACFLVIGYIPLLSLFFNSLTCALDANASDPCSFLSLRTFKARSVCAVHISASGLDTSSRFGLIGSLIYCLFRNLSTYSLWVRPLL